MVHIVTSGSRVEIASHTASVERASPSLTRVARDYDDAFELPPTAHPGRELATFSISVVLIITAVIWAGWKLISLLLT